MERKMINYSEPLYIVKDKTTGSFYSRDYRGRLDKEVMLYESYQTAVSGIVQRGYKYGYRNKETGEFVKTPWSKLDDATKQKLLEDYEIIPVTVAITERGE